MVFDISSSTNPVYVAGRDSSGSAGGEDAGPLYVGARSPNVLFVGKQPNATACSQTAGSAQGCELMVFDISSSTNPVYVAGRDSSGSAGGTGAAFVYGIIVANNFLFVGKSGDATACSQTAGSAQGCELMVFDMSNVSGNLIGISNLGNVVVSGWGTQINTIASTSNLTINGTLNAPPLLSVSDSFTNSGMFIANGGTTTFSGTSQQVATGTLSGTSAFHNLEIRNTFGNGTTSQGVVFGAPVQTTGTFSMIASSSARFLANATHTFAAVNWPGVQNSPVWLRSSATGTQWRFTTNSFVSTSYVNVRDSFNGSVQPVPCAPGCTNVANNTNWNFAGIGSITIGAHTAGQASNIFSFQNQTDATLFRFRLTAATETAIIDDVVLSLTGVRGLETGEVTDLRLYRDVNNDGVLDGGDAQVLGAGIMALSGEAGTITFSSGTTSVATTSATNFIVTADTDAIDNNDWMTVELRTSGITASGNTSLFPVTVSGGVLALQHIRSNAGGSGMNRSAIGGDAPTGTVRTGGGQGGGGNSGEAGQGQDGANIAPDPDFFRPTTNGSPHNEWTSGSNAYASDGTYATAASTTLRQTYGGFGFNIPGSNTIQGIQVKLDASGSTAAGTIQVALSWDGGNTITSLDATPTLSGSDVVYTLGGQTNLWGRSWTATELNNTNFSLRVVAQPSANTVRLDAIEVRIYHTAGGGGQGGGTGGGAI